MLLLGYHVWMLILLWYCCRQQRLWQRLGEGAKRGGGEWWWGIKRRRSCQGAGNVNWSWSNKHPLTCGDKVSTAVAFIMTKTKQNYDETTRTSKYLLGSPTLLSCSSNSLSREATLMSLKLRSRADPERRHTRVTPDKQNTARRSPAHRTQVDSTHIPITDSTVLLPG